MATKGRRLQGGLHFSGLCIGCNREAGDRWDSSYHELHEALGPAFFDETGFILPGAMLRPRRSPVRVGAAVRSILAGALGLNPQLRVFSPELPELLRAGDPFELPSDLDLRLAVAVGRRARITGGIGGHLLFGPVIGDLPLGNTAVAQCHDAPVAWQLVFRDDATLCDAQRWASIASWTEMSEDAEVVLADVCGLLPRVRLPQEHPQLAWQWVELLSDQTAFVIECEDIAPVPPT